MEKHIFITFAILSLNLFYISAQSMDSLNPEFKRRLEALLKEQNVPTAAVGLIEDNKMVATEVFGLGSSTNDAPSELLFSVASLTKPVSMMLALTLNSNNLWNLNEPLADYWIDPDVKEDSLVYQLSSRHVLSHQGGFTNWRSMNSDGKLAFDTVPGTSFRYSGEGFEYLRQAIEKKFHQSFEHLAESCLFKPFKMDHSFLTWPDNLDTLQYAGRFDQNSKRYPFEKITSANAAASLVTTIHDYTKFAVACLKGQGISKALNKQIHTPQIMVPQAKDVGIGLSWVVVKNLSGGEYALMHSGSDPGIKTFVILLPKSKRALVIFTNGDNGQKVYEHVLKELLDVGDEILRRMNQSS
ncbi:beta-lactamase family protein [Olivibacter sp. SDN3]|uniref:serine hydrolase domain-containing protein n=1 Tax=Olivibacter sp. SDN3 TaxID=2764720 RepID=UPI0016513A64|nr:serine hydrolase domain-containing protein [Olivibacter sp. SDN3]QNL51872.1 beta-lactamase family protein [Olivibacter sp. SDN3]